MIVNQILLDNLKNGLPDRITAAIDSSISSLQAAKILCSEIYAFDTRDELSGVIEKLKSTQEWIITYTNDLKGE